MILDLINIANELDKRSLSKEADALDSVIRKIAEDSSDLSLTESILGSNVGQLHLRSELKSGMVDKPINSLDDLTIMIDNPECDLECAEYAALKYRSSSAYQKNEDIEKEIVNALINSKRPEPGVEA